MFKYLLLATLIPAVLLQNADNIDYSDWDVVAVRPCAGARPLPAVTRLRDCPSVPCLLQRGTDAKMAVDFTAVQDASNLRTQVTATALGITAPYELPADRAAACNWLVQSRCPLTAGEDLVHHLSMPITAIYPLVSVAIEMDLVDESGQSHACFVVDARVVAA
ncbi:NPC intracellular cholesterol transporter 2 homolog a-like [Topomyia yanbarensis]|uniref:NPC intracellular cholesterol transporter 2 homolog a-like n=1 Tax=Topomyia yanbarensis TaxID=2498891 RepID=UPI00273C0C72|nr:NPC intracellular cholesterol transporter 2 homolog a-like [Topomyia yanbarensis]